MASNYCKPFHFLFPQMKTNIRAKNHPRKRNWKQGWNVVHLSLMIVSCTSLEQVQHKTECDQIFLSHFFQDTIGIFKVKKGSCIVLFKVTMHFFHLMLLLKLFGIVTLANSGFLKDYLCDCNLLPGYSVVAFNIFMGCHLLKNQEYRCNIHNLSIQVLSFILCWCGITM